jgi:transcriptional regulator with XRE-family HTH domain
MEKSGPRLRANRKKQQAFLSVLRQVRVEAGMRQEDLAQALGMPQSAVSKFESGERRLDLLELRDVCQALGISLIEFVRRFEGSLR